MECVVVVRSHLAASLAHVGTANGVVVGRYVWHTIESPKHEFSCSLSGRRGTAVMGCVCWGHGGLWERREYGDYELQGLIRQMEAGEALD